MYTVRSFFSERNNSINATINICATKLANMAWKMDNVISEEENGRDVQADSKDFTQ